MSVDLLRVVGVEADVLLELEAGLLDEADRLGGLAVLAGQRDLVLVQNRADPLPEDEAVVRVRVHCHAADNASPPPTGAFRSRCVQRRPRGAARPARHGRGGQERPTAWYAARRVSYTWPSTTSPSRNRQTHPAGASITRPTPHAYTRPVQRTRSSISMYSSGSERSSCQTRATSARYLRMPSWPR